MLDYIHIGDIVIKITQGLDNKYKVQIENQRFGGITVFDNIEDYGRAVEIAIGYSKYIKREWQQVIDKLLKKAKK